VCRGERITVLVVHARDQDDRATGLSATMLGIDIDRRFRRRKGDRWTSHSGR
jgi:hypothetical protein